MNRRGFMQRCFAGVAGAIVAFLPGKATTTCSTGVNHYHSTKKPEEAEFTIDMHDFVSFKGYLFSSWDNKVYRFRTVGNEGVTITLPTIDRFRYFHIHEDKLFWVGEHETWEIQYVGLRDTEFQWVGPNSEIHQPKTRVCYCHKPDNHVACNYPKCSDYNPGNEKPYKDEYE